MVELIPDMVETMVQAQHGCRQRCQPLEYLALATMELRLAVDPRCQTLRGLLRRPTLGSDQVVDGIHQRLAQVIANGRNHLLIATILPKEGEGLGKVVGRTRVLLGKLRRVQHLSHGGLSLSDRSALLEV